MAKAKKKSAARRRAERNAPEATAEIPEGSISRDALGKIVFYRDVNGTQRAAIVSSVANDGRTVALHVFDPGMRPDRNLLRAREGTERGQFSFELQDEPKDDDFPDSDEDHSS